LLLLDLSNCGPSGLLRVLYFLKLILDIVFIIVPIGLIIMLIIDFAKATVSNDDGTYSKLFKLASKRLLSAIIVFFVPTIVSIVNEVLGDLGVEYSACYNDISIEAIEQLEANEEAIEKAEKEAQLLLLKNKNEKTNNENEMVDIIKNSNAFLASGSGCDGMVYYEDGFFYRPGSSVTNGTSETKGSAPYGYNKYFYSMLSKMISDAAAAGHSITASSNENGAWRSYEKQLYFYNCYINKNCNNGNLAANPGTSNHGWGIASDLKFGDEEAKEWAHANAINYGLAFNVDSEDWHIVPALRKIDDSVVRKCK